MHITTPTIATIDSDKVKVAWTGMSGLNAWIEVNGAFVLSNQGFDSTSREWEVRIGSISKPFALAVQEDEADSELSPMFEMPTTAPLAKWDAAENARAYNLYHGTTGGVANSLLRTTADTGKERYSVKAARALDHGWHYFRVEGVDTLGRESTRAAWLYFAIDLPPYPTQAQVTKIGSEFVLTIGETQYLPAYLGVLPAYLEGLPLQIAE